MFDFLEVFVLASAVALPVWVTAILVSGAVRANLSSGQSRTASRPIGCSES